MTQGYNPHYKVPRTENTVKVETLSADEFDYVASLFSNPAASMPLVDMSHFSESQFAFFFREGQSDRLLVVANLKEENGTYAIDGESITMLWNRQEFEKVCARFAQLNELPRPVRLSGRLLLRGTGTSDG